MKPLDQWIHWTFVLFNLYIMKCEGGSSSSKLELKHTEFEERIWRVLDKFRWLELFVFTCAYAWVWQEYERLNDNLQGGVSNRSFIIRKSIAMCIRNRRDLERPLYNGNELIDYSIGISISWNEDLWGISSKKYGSSSSRSHNTPLVPMPIRMPFCDWITLGQSAGCDERFSSVP